ncbi:MAG: rhodanese-like domain-containing protein [Thermodesulfobacteriota bacterium]
MRKKRFFILIVMLTVAGTGIMTGCSHDQEALTWTQVIRDIRSKYPDVKQLRTDELYSWLTESECKSVILIDAREKKEFRVSHIAGARNIPYDKDPLKHLTDIKPDSPIVVYCSVGYRSSILARKLQDMGFTEVYNLEGSIFKWANEERPLVQGKVTVRKVHPYNANWGNLLERKYHVDAD